MYKKICFKCNKEKIIDKFYKHPGMMDGHLNKCKECCKKENRSNYRKNIEHYKEYERKRAQNPIRKFDQIEHQRKRRNKYPKKTKAYNYTKRNLIQKPCEVCGDPNSQAHHDNYNDVLNVTWLCRRHHLEKHGKTAF